MNRKIKTLLVGLGSEIGSTLISMTSLKKDIIEIMCGSLEFSASTSYVICQL